VQADVGIRWRGHRTRRPEEPYVGPQVRFRESRGRAISSGYVREAWHAAEKKAAGNQEAKAEWEVTGRWKSFGDLDDRNS
jgi:hypothetical protein